MKKFKILIFAMLLIYVLSGCSKATITYKIDNKFSTSVTYYLMIDKNILPQQQHISVHTIITTTSLAYEKKGFVIDHYQNDNDKIELQMTLTKLNQNLEEAYQALEDIMTDPSITFLTSVNQDHKVLEYDSALNMEVQIDLPLILNGTGIIKLPKNTQDDLINELENSDLELVFILPESAIVNKNEQTQIKQENNQTIISTPILIDQTTILKTQLRTSLNDNKPLKLSIEDSLIKSNRSIVAYQIMGYASGFIALLTLILIIKQKKGN